MLALMRPCGRDVTRDIGFVLLTHDKPQQVLRLVRRLTVMFHQPRIVVHHDFSKCSLPLHAFPHNVSFVRPHVVTGWGHFSVVEAGIAAIRHLYDVSASPEWFVLLSGADYPIKSAARVVRELHAGNYDAFMRAERIDATGHSHTDYWQRESYRRYLTKTFSYPSLTKRLRPTRRRMRVDHPLLTRPFLPFSSKFRCFSGDHWFSANREVAKYILEQHSPDSSLARHYRTVESADESYLQSIVGNAPHLRLSNDPLRYQDWSAGGPHPKTLGVADLPLLLASPAHFARKFDMDADSDILDALDLAVA